MNKNKKKQNKPSKNTGTVTKPILRIDWEDHCTANGRWSNIKEMDVSPKLVCSVGVLVHEDKKMVVLAQNVMSDVTMADTINIIKSCIVKRTTLGEVEFV